MRNARSGRQSAWLLAPMIVTLASGLVWVVSSWVTQFELARSRFGSTQEFPSQDVRWFLIGQFLGQPMFLVSSLLVGAGFVLRERRRSR